MVFLGVLILTSFLIGMTANVSLGLKTLAYGSAGFLALFAMSSGVILGLIQPIDPAHLIYSRAGRNKVMG